jgi:nucleotide-binding universal stress UspA family protein
LKLIGAVSPQDGEQAVQRRLDDAAMLVRDFARVQVSTESMPSGREWIVAAARGAGLLVVGLSERWRSEGLGETRSALARSVTTPVLFVRRGSRPGALAPQEDFTRFGWSSPGAGASSPGG